MPISGSEILSDIPEAIQLVEAVRDGVNSLPAVADRKPSDLMHLAAVVLNAAAPLADKLAEQAKS